MTQAKNMNSYRYSKRLVFILQAFPQHQGSRINYIQKLINKTKTAMFKK